MAGVSKRKKHIKKLAEKKRKNIIVKIVTILGLVYNQLYQLVPLSQIRAFARKSYGYMDAYRKGLDEKQAEYAVKCYKRHRILNTLFHNIQCFK